MSSWGHLWWTRVRRNFYITKDATFKESIKKPIEIKSLEEDENTTDLFDKNEFKKILDIVDSNIFGHKNNIGEFKYNEI